ncbi:MAG: LacI family DNA-binding transcriptional regulator [Anaerolineales bacterium]|nr:LacI family DNA-binding transcriptional regulator [Anaerolineales bacterium]
MTISIKDIARAAGVSHSTVSRALSKSSLVNAETRERIIKLAAEMGYSPHSLARSLVMGRTRSIGLVITTITDPFIAEVVQGIEDAAQNHGYTVVLCSSRGESSREMNAVDTLRSKRVDGVIVTSSRVGALYLEHLERIGVPVVLINNHNEQSGPYTFSIGVDNQHGGRIATDHLISLGHRRIAYITGPASHSDDLARLAGYRQALEEAGIPFDPSLVVPGTGRTGGGERALPLLMRINTPPTAAFCYNDMTAIGLMQSAAALKMAIPQDLAIVGFDDIPFASYIKPALTTVAQLKAEMGLQATEMVLALIGAKAENMNGFENRSIKAELIVRESSGVHIKRE